jgi:hypothetical protein
MVERVARAMLDAHSQWEIENNRLGGEVVWTASHLELLARTAIEAMREPTEEMWHAAELSDAGGRGWTGMWEAMIDRALN